jgi:hypothetical protein
MIACTRRLFKAETKKLRGSSLGYMVWLLPLLFILFEFFFFQYRLFGIKVLPDELFQAIDTLQIKMSAALWGAFFYPIFIAMTPALIFRIEHRYKMWKHLGAMPISQAHLYCVKAFLAVVLSLAALAFVWFLLMAEHNLMRYVAPQLQLQFHGYSIALVLGWLWLGSLPLTSIYLWMSNRINSVAVPVVFGIVGILLSLTLTSQELDENWKRDFIPWVTPNVCVMQILADTGADDRANLAGNLFTEEPDVIRLPSGKKITTWQNIPDHELFPPPPPTPKPVLASFSLIVCLLFTILGAIDAERCRK